MKSLGSTIPILLERTVTGVCPRYPGLRHQPDPKLCLQYSENQLTLGYTMKSAQYDG